MKTVSPASDLLPRDIGINQPPLQRMLVDYVFTIKPDKDTCKEIEMVMSFEADATKRSINQTTNPIINSQPIFALVEMKKMY